MFKRTYKILFILVFIQNTGYLLSQDTKEYTKFYYPNGQVSSEGMMRNGKPDGYWKTYYVSGVNKSEGLRTNFELDSTWLFYNQKGEVTEKIDYKYGKKNGYSIQYNYDKSPEGVIIAKELYVNDKKQGKAFYFHINGIIKEELTYVDGKRQGNAREYDESGKLVMLLEYNNNFLVSRERINRTDSQGLKQGSWKIFYENGLLYREMYYVNDMLDGIYREYNPEGKLILFLKYKQGKLVDEKLSDNNNVNNEIDFRKEFDQKGILKSSGGYRNGNPVGIHRYYDKEGKIINAEIFNEFGEVVAKGIVDETGNRNGPWKDFHKNGSIKSEGVYLNNLRSGKWTFYYPDGKKEQEGNFLRGNFDGTWRWYYENSNIWREESYFNGREDGEFIEYDIDGNVISKGDYINGEKEGEWYYHVGDHIEEGIFQTGLENGIWKHYYLDGALKFEGEYIQGLPEGKHKYYYPNGSVMEERIYRRGLKEKNWKKYSEEGNLLITITYRRDQEIRINGEKIKLPRSPVTRIR